MSPRRSFLMAKPEPAKSAEIGKNASCGLKAYIRNHWKGLTASLIATKNILNLIGSFYQSSPAPTLLSIAGLALLVGAAILDVWWYRKLKTLYMLNHELISAGPHAYVRHPGCLRRVTVALGAMLILLDVNLGLRACGERRELLVALTQACMAQAMFYAWIGAQTSVKDAQLHEKFGPDWAWYRIEVPYKIIPLIY